MNVFFYVCVYHSVRLWVSLCVSPICSDFYAFECVFGCKKCVCLLLFYVSVSLYLVQQKYDSLDIHTMSHRNTQNDTHIHTNNINHTQKQNDTHTLLHKQKLII